MTLLIDGSLTSTLTPVASDLGLHSPPIPAESNVRVLHIINGEHYSGAERVQDLLALCLPDEGFEVGFACLKPWQFPRLRRSQSSRLYELPMRWRLDLRVVRELRRILRHGGYQIVHAHTPRSALVGRLAASWSRLPFVYHAHSPTCRDTASRGRNWINRVAERLSLGGNCMLIAVSSSLGHEMVRQGLRQNRIAVVANGVPSPAVHRSADPPGSTWTLGVVALFRPRKGMEVLLDALAILRRQQLSWQLRAVGSFETKEYETQIKDQAKRLGLDDRIQWVGFCRDVATELAEMDLLVLPSLFGEGMPMVVLEALAAGVPVVATCVEGIPEAVDDGVQGLLARPGDAADLARCIERIVGGELPWALMRQNALSRHAERFSDRRMAAGVAEVYRRLLARGTAANRRSTAWAGV